MRDEVGDLANTCDKLKPANAVRQVRGAIA
jgi:hypothetical protein